MREIESNTRILDWPERREAARAGRIPCRVETEAAKGLLAEAGKS